MANHNWFAKFANIFPVQIFPMCMIFALHAHTFSWNKLQHIPLVCSYASNKISITFFNCPTSIIMKYVSLEKLTRYFHGRVHTTTTLSLQVLHHHCFHLKILFMQIQSRMNSRRHLVAKLNNQLFEASPFYSYNSLTYITTMPTNSWVTWVIEHVRFINLTLAWNVPAFLWLVFCSMCLL